MTPIVHLVDDDHGVRKALGFSMRTAGLEIELHESARAFLDHYVVGTPGCLVVDVRMPRMSGLQLQAELMRRAITLPVIVLTGYADVPMAVRAMRAGAVDFFEKPVNEQLLLERIFEVLGTQSDSTSAEARHGLAARREQLTRRQREVFDLMVQGLQNKQIAERLRISIRTVEVHRSRILKVLDAPSVTRLLTLLLADGQGPRT